VLYSRENEKSHYQRTEYNAGKNDQEQGCEWHINAIYTGSKPWNAIVNV
jgi:hypothetical protein